MDNTFVREVFRNVKRRAESSLQTDFSRVSLTIKSRADLGGTACATGHEVTLAEDATALPKGELCFILAHELAHIAQKQNLGPASAPTFLEDEANQIAACITAGNPAVCMLADVPERPAYYEELGHYYTAYFVMLAAGVDPMGARVRAFFCQLPDEVIQFDATSATRDYNEYADLDSRNGPMSILAHVGGTLAGIPRATPESEIEYETHQGTIVDGIGDVHSVTMTRETDVSMAARRQRDQAAIQGLHCLTDRKSQEETDFRIQTLKANWEDPVISGLALHPFGDSFSHRREDDDTLMYGSHHGHAGDMHSPDYAPMRPKLYLDYAETLYNTVRELTGGTAPPFSIYARPRLDAVLAAKGCLSGKSAEHACLKEMKNTLMCRLGYDNSYEPEKFSGKYWSEFSHQHADFLKHPLIGGSVKARAKIEIAGRTWKERRAKVG